MGCGYCGHEEGSRQIGCFGSVVCDLNHLDWWHWSSLAHLVQEL